MISFFHELRITNKSEQVKKSFPVSNQTHSLYCYWTLSKCLNNWSKDFERERE